MPSAASSCMRAITSGKEEGKKLEFWPFAIIWLSKDGKSRKTATSDRAKVELREPMGLLKSGASSPHIVEAKLIDNVWLRDDKGTRPDTSDDLVISGPDGGLPYMEYTEKTNPPEIRTVSNIKLVDQNMTLTGYNLLIYLRKDEGRVRRLGSRRRPSSSTRISGSTSRMSARAAAACSARPGRPQRAGRPQWFSAAMA